MNLLENDYLKFEDWLLLDTTQHMIEKGGIDITDVTMKTVLMITYNEGLKHGIDARENSEG